MASAKNILFMTAKKWKLYNIEALSIFLRSNYEGIDEIIVCLDKEKSAWNTLITFDKKITSDVYDKDFIVECGDEALKDWLEIKPSSKYYANRPIETLAPDSEVFLKILSKIKESDVEVMIMPDITEFIEQDITKPMDAIALFRCSVYSWINQNKSGVGPYFEIEEKNRSTMSEYIKNGPFADIFVKASLEDIDEIIKDSEDSDNPRKIVFIEVANSEDFAKIKKEGYNFFNLKTLGNLVYVWEKYLSNDIKFVS